jgi:hypothetical protein
MEGIIGVGVLFVNAEEEKQIAKLAKKEENAKENTE